MIEKCHPQLSIRRQCALLSLTRSALYYAPVEETAENVRLMDYVVGQWLIHYLAERPHRGKGIGNRVLDPTFRPQRHGTVCCRHRLGGILKSYYRAAA